MKLSDIKINQSLKEVKQMVYPSEIFNLETMPAFLNTKYKQIRNMESNESIFVLFDDGVITDIQTEFNKIADMQTAYNNLQFILENV